LSSELLVHFDKGAIIEVIKHVARSFFDSFYFSSHVFNNLFIFDHCVNALNKCTDT